MSALTLPLFWRWPTTRTTTDSAARTDPPTPPARQPVFIYDAVTPWQGETILAARLKADLDRALVEQDD